MLDTNMVSYILTGRSPAARVKLAGLGIDDVACVSAIAEAELRYGVAKTPNSSSLRPALNRFLSRIEVLPWNSEEADAYGWLRAKQEVSGKTLGNMDMLIAAHAIAVDAILITRDKSFAQVPDLRAIENWASEL